MSDLECYKRVVREGFRLALSDERITEIYKGVIKRIEDFKTKHPDEWQEMEEENQRGVS